jgi:hypothetical protein
MNAGALPCTAHASRCKERPRACSPRNKVPLPAPSVRCRSTYIGFTPDLENCGAHEQAAAGAARLGDLTFTGEAPFNLSGLQVSSDFLTEGLYRHAPVE